MDQTNILVYAIIFQIILVVIICSSIFLPANSNIISVFRKIPSSAYIITVISILLTYLSVKASSFKEACATGFNIVDRGEKDVYENFVKYYNDVPNFIDSMQFNFNPEKQQTDNENSPRQNIIKDYLAILIFQAIEDYIISSSITDLSDKEWFIMFLSWFQSDLLQDIWTNKMYINFAEYTNRYIDKLIEFSKEKKPFFTSNSKVNEISGEFVLSPDYIKLLNKEDKFNISFRGY